MLNSSAYLTLLRNSGIRQIRTFQDQGFFRLLGGVVGIVVYLATLGFYFSRKWVSPSPSHSTRGPQRLDYGPRKRPEFRERMLFRWSFRNPTDYGRSHNDAVRMLSDLGRLLRLADAKSNTNRHGNLLSQFRNPFSQRRRYGSPLTRDSRHGNVIHKSRCGPEDFLATLQRGCRCD